MADTPNLPAPVTLTCRTLAVAVRVPAELMADPHALVPWARLSQATQEMMEDAFMGRAIGWRDLDRYGKPTRKQRDV